MKKTLCLALTCIALLVASIVLFRADRQVEAVTVQINVKDTPTHDLKLIGPSDPSFEGRISALTKGNNGYFLEASKPYSVFLKNASNKAVVGYWLKWEMTKPDGTIISRESGGINPATLMDGGTPGFEHLSVTKGYAIKPNGSHFVSLGFSLDEDQGGTIGAYIGGSVDQSTASQLQQAVKDSNLAPLLNHITAELRTYSSITVSIDGAFFEDGTFVGPDSTGFFAKMQANIDAKRDLLEEIAFAIKHHRTNADIFKDIKELTSAPDISTFVTPADYYNYYKKMYATEILNMKRAVGSEQALAIALQPLRKPWPRLKKQGNGERL